MSVYQLEFVRTNTRFLGIKMRKGTTITIDHDSRSEAVDASGMILGADLTKEGTPVDVPEKPCVRRIEVPAILGAGWDIDPNAEQECGDLEPLVAKMHALVQACDNQTYKAAWLAACGQVQLGMAEFRIYRQFCGIKIVLHKMPMDTESRREAYAQLMRHANGTSENRRFFNTDHAVRWMVVEPYDIKTGGGYFMDKDGVVYTKESISDEDGEAYQMYKAGKLFEATAVYNKPEADAAKHWIPISEEEAKASFQKYGKAIPHDFIDVMYKLVAKCEA